MDQKWIFKHVIGMVVLVLLNITQTETLEYYCTREGNWTTAMYTCLDSGGTPATYIDLANGKEVKVKDGITVWTADYVYLDYAEGLSQINTNYDCGYITFKESQRWSSTKSKYIYTYTPTGDVNYDICTRKRWFVCENLTNTFEGWWTATWPEAYSSCSKPYKLWKGYTSIEKTSRPDFFRYSEFWVNSVRRLVQDSLSRPEPVMRSITNCGTSEELAKREGNNSCDQDLRAVCRFDHKIASTGFSQSCLQALFPWTKPRPDVSTKAADNTSEQSVETSYKFPNSSVIQSTPDELSKTTIIVIATATKAIAIVCTVTVVLLLYFYKKRRKRNDADSCTVQFKNDSPSAGRVSLSRHENIADRAWNRDEAEVEAYYEVVPDNIQILHISETTEGCYEVIAPVKLESAHGNKTQERYNEGLVQDSIQSVHVIGKEEGRYEVIAPVNQEPVYVSETQEGYYEGSVPQNTLYVHCNERKEGYYEKYDPVKQNNVYVNETPEDYYEQLVPDDTEHV